MTDYKVCETLIAQESIDFVIPYDNFLGVHATTANKKYALHP